MITIFKKLICKHDWIKTGTEYRYKNAHFIMPATRFKCAKCGKVIYK